MPPPIGGADSAIKTHNTDVITLDSSDEFDISNARSQESLKMDIGNTSTSIPSDRCGSPVNQADTSLHTQKTDKIKYFKLNPDKYNSNNIYVYIEKTNDQNIGRLHPMYVGHILHKKLQIKNITDIKSIGKNRIKVQVKTTLDANNLINNNLLCSENLRAYIPNHLLEKRA